MHWLNRSPFPSLFFWASSERVRRLANELAKHIELKIPGGLALQPCFHNSLIYLFLNNLLISFIIKRT